MIEELIDELQEEADLCRNETADDIANLLDKAANELKILFWQPIETAPNDGTVILGYRDGRIGMASRVPRTDCEMWTFISTTASVNIMPSVKPTHWMPLPEPPK